MTRSSFARRLGSGGVLLLLVALLSAPVTSTPADARVGGGFSFGSRGTRTFSAPAATPTAPRAAQPFQRTETPPFAEPAGQGRRFGFGSGLLAGLLGAGLMGSLFGGGFFGGIAALVGLLFKLAVVGGLILLVLRLVRSRTSSPAMAGLSARGPAPRPDPLSGGVPGRSARSSDLTVGPSDYAAFEAALLAIQEAHSREDLQALARLATPEMVRHLAADLETNRRRGLRNDVSQVRLVSGDLSEAWHEGSVAYATVAMRFAAVDVMVDRRAGAIVSGDPVRPVEATELWTFRRAGPEGWRLSAIQQVG